MTGSEASEVIERASSLPFDATVERLVDAITDHGMMVFAHIDHAANARAIGMDMPPTTVLIYGNPKGGTPVMLATPSAALDLPLRVLVREREDGVALMAFHPIVGMLNRIGVPADAATRLELAEHVLLAAVTP